MTPRELAWEYAAAQQRASDDADRAIVLAWQIERVRVLSANAAHQKKAMPSLADVLQKGARRQSVAQLKGTLMMLADQYRLPLKKTVH